MTFEELSVKVLDWAEPKGLLKEENILPQFTKLIEESGELASGILKKDSDKIIDSIGDVLVVILILSEQLELDPVECLEIAYNEIKNRKGKTVGGSFIKES